MYFTIVSISFLTILFAIILVRWGRKREKCLPNVKTLIVIGSGGHTAEIMRFVAKFKPHYQPRLYVMAENDSTSQAKVLAAEKQLDSGGYEVVRIPRSRNVGQSFATSVFSTAYSVISSFSHVKRFAPDLVLCNGPGTCVPICIVAVLLSKVLGWGTKIIFIESICRVESLSLSAKILMPFADYVVVHWPELQEKYPKTVYLGKIL